eukprot:6182280-Pleurochrysis_carterae.AAC.1
MLAISATRVARVALAAVIAARDVEKLGRGEALRSEGQTSEVKLWETSELLWKEFGKVFWSLFYPSAISRICQRGASADFIGEPP